MNTLKVTKYKYTTAEFDISSSLPMYLREGSLYNSEVENNFSDSKLSFYKVDKEYVTKVSIYFNYDRTKSMYSSNAFYSIDVFPYGYPSFSFLKDSIVTIEDTENIKDIGSFFSLILDDGKGQRAGIPVSITSTKDNFEEVYREALKFINKNGGVN